jgi:hypothetical protein
MNINGTRHVSHRSTFHTTEVSGNKHVRGYIQKFPDWVYNEINNKNKHSLRSNTKFYGGETH